MVRSPALTWIASQFSLKADASLRRSPLVSRLPPLGACTCPTSRPPLGAALLALESRERTSIERRASGGASSWQRQRWCEGPILRLQVLAEVRSRHARSPFRAQSRGSRPRGISACRSSAAPSGKRARKRERPAPLHLAAGTSSQFPFWGTAITRFE